MNIEEIRVLTREKEEEREDWEKLSLVERTKLLILKQAKERIKEAANQGRWECKIYGGSIKEEWGAALVKTLRDEGYYCREADDPQKGRYSPTQVCIIARWM